MSDDEYCFHSMMVPDCLPCWKGAYRRQETHIQRLRQIIVNADAGDILEAHDDYWFGGNKQPLPAPKAIANYRRMARVAGDLWNELENLREHWEDLPNAPLIEEHIAAYEEAAGI